MSSPTPPVTAEELRDAQAKEYSVYTALGPIDVHGTRAFNRGDAVPVGHVEQNATDCPVCEATGYANVPHVRADQVAKVTTKAGREAAGITDTTSKG